MSRRTPERPRTETKHDSNQDWRGGKRGKLLKNVKKKILLMVKYNHCDALWQRNISGKYNCYKLYYINVLPDTDLNSLIPVEKKKESNTSKEAIHLLNSGDAKEMPQGLEEDWFWKRQGKVTWEISWACIILRQRDALGMPFKSTTICRITGHL